MHSIPAKVVESVLDDWQSAPIPTPLKATLGLLEKLTLRPAEVGPADMAPLRTAGLSDEAITEAIYICFLFNTIDRLADAFDFELAPPEKQKRIAKMMNRFGYRLA